MRANGPIEIVGEDFAANDVVRIELHREGVKPVELGRVPADAEGNFDATLHVPASVPAGAEQPAGDTAAVENDRPYRETVGLGIFTAVIAVVAVGLLWSSRTHARSIA